MHIEDIIKQKAEKVYDNLRIPDVDVRGPLDELLTLIRAWEPQTTTYDAATFQLVDKKLAEFKADVSRFVFAEVETALKQYVDEKLSGNEGLSVYDEERVRAVAKSVISDTDWDTVFTDNVADSSVWDKVKEEISYSDVAKEVMDYLDSDDLAGKVVESEAFKDGAREAVKEVL